jgi:triacylglycerol lipase
VRVRSWSVTVTATTVVVLAALVAVGAGGAPSDAVTRPARTRLPVPVLLVHGFDGSSASWHVMVTRLERAGYPPDRIDTISYSSSISNVDVAHQIVQAVAALRRRTGAAQVDIVSHSMGAISSRYYLEDLGGTASVDAWVSLAGVNSGTIWAYGCYFLSPCREMVPTASLLGDLNRDFPPVGATRYATWWSPCDTAVVPHTNAELPGARNTETACLGHSDLKSDPTVFAQVLRFLREVPRATVR